jgi:hypothetical protein
MHLEPTRNAHFCCARFYSTLDNIINVNQNTINQRAVEQLSTNDYFRVSLIRELYSVSQVWRARADGPQVLAYGHYRHDRRVSTSVGTRVSYCTVLH